MGTLVNAQTNQDVNDFIENVKSEKRKEDAKIVLELIREVTGKEPKIWGKNIVGFGKYKYQRKNGQEFEWFNVGFSPASKHTSLYFMFDVNEEPLTKKLGTHTCGKGCLYVKKIEDIDLEVLKKMVAKSDKWER